MSSSPREDSSLHDLAQAYYMAQRNAIHGAHLPRHVTSAVATFSDDDASSDADSNEGHIDVTSAHKDPVSESGFVEGSSGLKSNTDEEGTDSNRSGNSGHDDVGDVTSPPGSATHLSHDAVKLQALDTTRVAVAQVVNSNDEEKDDVSDANGEKLAASMEVPQLQSMLAAIQRQQLFQLQVLHSIQHVVAEHAHQPDVVQKHFASIPWLRFYAPALHAQATAHAGSEVRAVLGDNHDDAGDEMSEGSVASGVEADHEDLDVQSPRHNDAKDGKSLLLYSQLAMFFHRITP